MRRDLHSNPVDGGGARTLCGAPGIATPQSYNWKLLTFVGERPMSMMWRTGTPPLPRSDDICPPPCPIVAPRTPPPSTLYAGHTFSLPAFRQKHKGRTLTD